MFRRGYDYTEVLGYEARKHLLSAARVLCRPRLKRLCFFGVLNPTKGCFSIACTVI